MSALDLKQRAEGPGYILVDLDRTLAYYSSWNKNGNEIGQPVPAMLERVVRWLRTGHDVRIFTARASRNDPAELDKIRAWCVTHIGTALPIQNWKDFHCIAIWDDLAVSVQENTGWRTTILKDDQDPIHMDEELELVKLSKE